jgi:hypothetical protein
LKSKVRQKKKKTKQNKKFKFKMSLLKALAFITLALAPFNSPFDVTTSATRRFEPTFPWGEREELITKRTLFQVF